MEQLYPKTEEVCKSKVRPDYVVAYKLRKEAEQYLEFFTTPHDSRSRSVSKAYQKFPTATTG
jgi:hypothetical protein